MASHALDLHVLVDCWREQDTEKNQEGFRDTASQRQQGQTWHPVLPMLTDRTMQWLPRAGGAARWLDASLRYVGEGAAFYPAHHELTQAAEAARDAALAEFEAELLAMQGEQSAALAHFRHQFGRPGGVVVRVFSCPGPFVQGFAVPGGFAVIDRTPDGLAAAVKRGVHSMLRSAGMPQARGDFLIRRGNSWEGRSLAANLLLFPLTDRLCLPVMLLNACCMALDPQRRADSQRSMREALYTSQRHEWARKRSRQLRQEGREEEAEALLRAHD